MATWNHDPLCPLADHPGELDIPGCEPCRLIELGRAAERATEGPYGWCAMRGCHNPAFDDIGLPVCMAHDEANSLGAAWSTAQADVREAWGVTIDNGWVEAVEAAIRSKLRVVAFDQD